MKQINTFASEWLESHALKALNLYNRNEKITANQLQITILLDTLFNNSTGGLFLARIVLHSMEIGLNFIHLTHVKEAIRKVCESVR